MSVALHIATCHACDRRQAAPGPDGSLPCKADPARRDIIALAVAGACPLGYFTPGTAGTPLSADAMAAAEARRPATLAVCRGCTMFRGIQPNEMYVNCAAATSCCGGGEGEVSLGFGACPRNLWLPHQAAAAEGSNGI